ncbi:MAG: hemerythrin domain-containing protein [Thermoplasmata archaeon]|nr:hemerythrin domain-containing protein [Thermoplasmata archaeon]
MAMQYDPIRTLMDEHQLFLARVEAMRETWRRGTKNSGPESELPRQVAEFARFLVRDVDELHGAKEEQALFPVLERHMPEGGPVSVMRSEHEMLRGFQRTLERSSGALESDAENERAVAATGRVLGEVDSLLSQHIVKEDFVLFPTAKELLSRTEFLQVSEACLEIERAYRERYGQNPELLPTGGSVVSRPPTRPVRA